MQEFLKNIYNMKHLFLKIHAKHSNKFLKLENAGQMMPENCIKALNIKTSVFCCALTI